MPGKQEHHKKKLQSEHAADEIRADDFVKATQIEARKNEEKLRNIPVENKNYWRFKGDEKHSPLPKGIKWGIVGLVVLFIGGFIASYYIVRHHVAVQVSSRLSALQAGIADLQSFNTQSAEREFSSLGGTSSSSPSGIFSTLISVLTGSAGDLKAFSDLSSQLTLLSQDLGTTQNDAFGFISGANTGGISTQNGTTTLVSDLTNIKTVLAAIDTDTDQLSNAASSLGNTSPISGQGYLALKTQVQGAENFLDAFIPWLSNASTTHHLLVLLQNPSEMRPGGGFLGSYADVSIRAGAITDVSVHDIADVDKTFTQKIIPPVPLQLEETGFRPADANWFFDFPTSASETIGMFQRSGLYANASSGPVTFDGAIAITPQILSDLLSVTGPISIPNAAIGQKPANSSTTFSADNLVVQVQKIVQAGQAKSAGSVQTTYPKAVLGVLSQLLFQGIASSTDAQKSQMFGLVSNWIAQKDVMVYFVDPRFESFATTYGATGDVYQLPQNFNGDYLAIANADINSDKSELYIAQNINFDTEIGNDGTATDHLIVTRTHNGKESPYWWYQTTNQDYMQIFVPNDGSLQNESGGIKKTVPAPINYTNDAYSTDPLVVAIQSSTEQNFTYPNITTHQEEGKEVYAMWSRTYAGSSSTISIEYTHHLYAPPSNGQAYQFIFEKQAGAQGDDTFEIDAPLGYVFAENGLATYIYESTSTPGRLIIDLTLQKLAQ